MKKNFISIGEIKMDLALIGVNYNIFPIESRKKVFLLNLCE